MLHNRIYPYRPRELIWAEVVYVVFKIKLLKLFFGSYTFALRAREN